MVSALVDRLRSDPENPSLHLELARAHVDHEEWRLALAEIEIVESIEPEAHRTSYLRGRALWQAGQMESARRAFDDHLDKCPGDGLAWVARGRLRYAMSDAVGAVADLTRGRKLMPVITIDVIVDQIRAVAAAGEVFEASQLADEAVGEVGADPELLRTVLEIERAAGLWDAALRRVDALKLQAPRPEPWLAERARILEMADRPADSKKAWSELLAALQSLPNLERGTPQNLALLADAQRALGEVVLSPVVAAPAPAP